MADWTWEQYLPRRREGGGAEAAEAPAAPDAAQEPGTTAATSAVDGPQNPQLLAANSFLFGTTNLLVLDLPKGWTLRDGFQRPEVDSRQLQGEVSWATMGLANYYLRQPEAARPIELWVRLQPKPPRPVEGEPFEVAGHTGMSRSWRDARGLEHQQIRWSCPKSGRAVELEASGSERAALDELATALRRCQCHQA